MRLHRSLLGPALLLTLGGAIACTASPDQPFPRDGFVDPSSDDDDDAHDGPNHGGDAVAGDRVAFWDFVQTRGFDGGEAEYTTRASFFDYQRLGIPQPQGPGECLRNGTDADPWEPMQSNDLWGQPTLEADGEEWDLEQLGVDYWVRGLPPRTWTDFDDLTIAIAGDVLGEATEYEEALSLPETLIGVAASLDPDDGLVVEWQAGDANNQLLLVLKGDDSGRTEYVVCTPLDDGDFTVPAAMFEDYPAGDVEVLLRRERTREDWRLDDVSLGRTVGVSQLRASFTISSETFGGGSD